VRHYYQFKASGSKVTGQLVASYEYDAFGREVRAWGLNTPTENQPPGLPASRPWADLLPFHYSSKLRDVDSGFNYYGYRFYDPGAGRWLNRDPIEEEGGVNLYGMLLNDPLNWIDVLGMSKPSCEEFEKYYPKFIYKNGGVSTDRVYDDVGGWVDGAHDNSINKARGAYQDSCALRASIALNGCGGPHKIPTSGGRGDGINRVPDGKKPKDNVILSAERMCAYLEKQFGKPDYEGDAGFIQMQANSDKACGCFCFVSCSDAHVAFTGIRGEPDSIPTNGKNGKAKGWKLPCKNHGNQ
jgi:RHS repeat-associated protein